MWQSAGLHFAADHPAAAGHFPGNPIIPGALLLDEVVRAITGGGDDAVTIRAAKFLQPVRPGDAVDLRWRRNDAGAVSFECALGARGLAVTGMLEVTSNR